MKYHRVNYRMLCFLHGRIAAVVSHEFSKEREVPPGEIRLAKEHMRKFKADPDRRTLRREE